MVEFQNIRPFIRPYSGILLLSLLLLVASGLFELLIVIMLEPIFNLLSPAAGSQAALVENSKFGFLLRILGPGETALPRIAIFLVVFSVLKGFALYLAEYLMSYSGQQVVASLRKKLYEHILVQPMAFFSRHPTGQLMARIITDTERVQLAVSRHVTDFFRQAVLLMVFLVAVFYIDWRLTLLASVLAPLVLYLTVWLGRKMRRLSWRSQERISDLSEVLQETITGQEVVKAFGMEDYERHRFTSLNDSLVKVNLKVARVAAASSPSMEFFGYLLFVPFLLYAHQRIGQGVSIGSFVAFLVALYRLYDPIRRLSKMHLMFQQAAACSSRIFALLHTPVELRDRPDAVALPPFKSKIRFEAVSFHYDPASRLPVLEDINLEVCKGEIVALVGKSGAGKSTLVSLIPRFFEVSSGRITIDGLDIRDVTQVSLRSRIAIVSQETFLFNDTIRNNIAYGQENRNLDEVVEAARAAFVHEFIEDLPYGYNSIIGERGHRLSGGQRQRIAIARAILKRAPILILDEATSSLDSESERLVQQALNNLMQNCTTLVIAHRLSTVRMADRIIVLDGGRIVESGDHTSLMQRPGVYRKLHDIQFADSVPGVAQELEGLS